MWAGYGWILLLIKWVHFFLGPWLLVCQFVEISNQMELNDEVWNFGYYNKSDFQCNSQSFRLRHFDPFDWKCLQIGTLGAKDIRQNVFILQKGWSTHFPHTQPVIGVVLLLCRGNALRLLKPNCSILCNIYHVQPDFDFLQCSYEYKRNTMTCSFTIFNSHFLSLFLLILN